MSTPASVDVTDPQDPLGPIDYLVLRLPGGALPRRGLQSVLDAVRAGTVQVLDLELVGRAADGSATSVALEDVPDADPDVVEAFSGACSGLLEQDDLEAVAQLLVPGELAVAVVYENLWAAPVLAAFARDGARLLDAGAVASADLDDVLGRLEQVTA